MAGSRKAWEALQEAEAENNKRQYQFWEKKYRILMSKGKLKEAEDAKKHLDYWLTLI